MNSVGINPVLQTSNARSRPGGVECPCVCCSPPSCTISPRPLPMNKTRKGPSHFTSLQKMFHYSDSKWAEWGQFLLLREATSRKRPTPTSVLYYCPWLQAVWGVEGTQTPPPTYEPSSHTHLLPCICSSWSFVLLHMRDTMHKERMYNERIFSQFI